MSESGNPTGTVTFLFTDIEGSTQLWERHPNQARAALVRHDRIIEEVVDRHDGRIVRPRGEGDSRFAVFSRATDALTAAAAMQQALHTEPWPTPTPLRVRVALHTGEADLRQGDYYGSAVNRCARLRAVAHGGQTLVSTATQELVRENLLDGIALRDLGEHQLKDLQYPEHIYQLVVPGLPADFPPLKSLDVLPNNLPVQLTSFIGRERDIAEAKRLLSAARLVTLAGPGGTGKTRLSLQVAADLLEAYADGVWLVELAPVVDGALVPQVLASVLGVREVGDSPLTDTLIVHLRPKTILLLLDNCEHLIEDCARLAEALLRACAHLSILASSREPLGVAGEVPYRVPSLSVPDRRDSTDPDSLARYEAVRLFVERARLGQPGFVLTDQNALAVAEICLRLDGIPLAIELAAARVKFISVEQIAARLDDRFRLLTGGSRTAVPRQQTLQAAIDWSYDLLSREECVLLRRLSVFMGGWSLEAAEAVGGGEGIDTFDVLDLLSRLVDKSLVQVEQAAGSEGARYRLLETIRQYAANKLLEAGETERVRDRHLQFFVQMAEELEPTTFGAGAKVSWARLEVEHDNIRAALEWSLGGDVGVGRNVDMALRLAGALRTFWYWHGPLNEGRQWLERAINLRNSSPPQIQVTPDPEPAKEDRSQLATWGKALQGAGMLATQQADTQLARKWLEESVSVQRQLGNMEDLAQSLHILGHVIFDELDYDEARALFEESLAMFRRLGDKLIGPSLVGDLGLVAYVTGDYPEARRHLEQSLSEYHDMKAIEGETIQVIRLGDLARSEGDFDSAAELYERGLAQSHDLDSAFLRSNALHKLGQIARHQGDNAKAVLLLKESLKMQRDAGNKLGIAECLAALAGVADAQGQAGTMQSEGTRRAARLFGATDALLERIKIPMTPADGAQHAVDHAAARSHLDEQAWESAWAEGRAMSQEQAIEYALAQTTPQATAPSHTASPSPSS